MAIKAEISWVRKDSEGHKTQVNARKAGGTWRFFHRAARHDVWLPLHPVPLEDWLELLDSIRRRIPRRLMTPEEERRVVEAIRQQYPSADL